MTAPAPSSSTSQHESENALWECLNSDFTMEVADESKDLIGVLNPCGYEVHAIPMGVTPSSASCARTTNYDFQVKAEALDETNTHQWIQSHPIRSQVDASLRVKVLIVDQVIWCDRLRPPTDAQAIRFSRKVLYTNTGCPPVALEKASRNESWVCDFPRDQRDDTRIDCRGFGTSELGIIWMSKAGCSTVWAIIRLQGSRVDVRENIIRDLYNLRSFSELPGFLPFIAINAAVYILQKRMDAKVLEIGRSGLKLERFPDTRTANEVYGESISSARTIAIQQRNTRNMQKMVGKCLRMPAPTNAKHDLRLRRTASSLKRAFTYQKQVLQDILENTEEYQGHTSRQIECVLSIMAQRQQELSIEIARGQSKLAEASRREQMISIDIANASHRIAEETKKDGTSMKTLAVVTLVYLPCTTVSSVLAMPLFDWNADNRSIVNPRIWVYFVFAVPLTAITLVIWRLWLRYRAGGKVEAFDSDSANAGKQSLP